jgi:Protein of unknown function (DUF2934)
MATKKLKSNAPESSSEQEMAGNPERESKIAELAYFKAEQRGFASGSEMDDWLEAERECLVSET